MRFFPFSARKSRGGIQMKKVEKYLGEVEGLLKELASETDKVKQSEFFRQYLNAISRFWKYSYHNQLLIVRQMPKATRVAGFRTWNSLNRRIRKGSKAIKILAPSIRKTKGIDPKTSKEVDKQEVYFFPVSVFDQSQTEGEPLPDINITVEGDDHQKFLNILLEFCEHKNIKVDFRNLGVNGLYGYSKGGQIAITNTESINTQTNVLIHEIGHELLLHKGSKLSKQHREIQAEGVSYVVTRHFGMQNKSFDYLALYHADYKKIMENLEAISS
ncbi:ImmA/IrrE family metallo-endopeptidase, partial [Candidatus Poribacteria bacterium]|nr:ImmA/IrrE family metallo-endopeptidase [Candidatus Poribacteria bacterium]